MLPAPCRPATTSLPRIAGSDSPQPPQSITFPLVTNGAVVQFTGTNFVPFPINGTLHVNASYRQSEGVVRWWVAAYNTRNGWTHMDSYLDACLDGYLDAYVDA